MTDLKVIGAGLGRTGTKSLQQALVLLGFGPCHHMSLKIRLKMLCSSGFEVYSSLDAPVFTLTFLSDHDRFESYWRWTGSYWN